MTLNSSRTAKHGTHYGMHLSPAPVHVQIFIKTKNICDTKCFTSHRTHIQHGHAVTCHLGAAAAQLKYTSRHYMTASDEMRLPVV